MCGPSGTFLLPASCILPTAYCILLPARRGESSARRASDLLLPAYCILKLIPLDVMRVQQLVGKMAGRLAEKFGIELLDGLVAVTVAAR